jgi:hypothetical protein
MNNLIAGRYNGLIDLVYRPLEDPGEVQLLAEMPRFIRGSYAPQGAIIKTPHLDSPYIDEQIRRGFVPMTPPPIRGAGPQLPGFV